MPSPSRSAVSIATPAIERGALPGYAELQCASNFSFLRGASHPEQLVARAAELGYAAIAITDECSVAGVVRAHGEAKRQGLQLIVGSQFRVDDGNGGMFRLVALAMNSKEPGPLLDAAARAYAVFAEHPQVDAFSLGASLRQLREVWGLDGADPVFGKPVRIVKAAILSVTACP